MGLINFAPHMPNVDVVVNAEETIAKAWAMAEATDEKGRSPIALTPGHQMLFPLGGLFLRPDDYGKPAAHGTPDPREPPNASL